MSATMKAMFEVQQKLKSDLGLQKVVAVYNKNYKANGTKSYVSSMRKFGFTPTKPGPYSIGRRLHQRGLIQREHIQHGSTPTHHPVGGRAYMVPYLAKLAQDGSPGDVTAEDQQNDSLYLCEVDIGTPPQKLSLDFDTGSADLWVFSTELSASLQKDHDIFNPSKSSTYKTSSGLTWKIEYGDGSSASGDVGTDVVTLGGLAIQNQAVELAKNLSDQFAQGTGDGLLGLAWPSINTIKKSNVSDAQPTPMANLISSNTLPQDAQIFTSCFYSSRDAGKESFYTFGYIDQDLITSSGKDIVWADVDNSEGFWMFPSVTASVNGQSISRSGNTAIADTGTTLCLVADDVCAALYKAIPGAKYDDSQQGYLIPSSTTVDQLPTFSLAVGDNEFVIQKEDLVFGDPQDGFWFGGVQSRGENSFDILGDTFLKSIYAIWDQGKTRFGAVPKLQATQNLSNGGSSTDGNASHE